MRAMILATAMLCLSLPAYAVECGEDGYLRWECNPALQRDHPTGLPAGTLISEPPPVVVVAPVEEPEEEDPGEEEPTE